ncbi:hypothetical protein CV102_11970 [Natronococcus pandeyae]|uniref:Uncharacterized protein n=1 Tax=Natronococcus pandeyae TaxID=2055836 RepID=A0A8J8TSG5_9EURY|nr:hypothetical protein [Natronococcus pandeyae]TYL38512.1 hypothetical protein CV102_11970 [Natronococcus pandeyae]
MTDNLPQPGDADGVSRTTRRTALGVLGTSALGIGAAAIGAADDGHDGARNGRREARVAGPDPEDYVDSSGAPLEEPDDGTELFDPEPEFPPYVTYDEMVDEFGEKAEAYLEPHGSGPLLDSRRSIVDPEGEPLTWGEYGNPEGTATVTTRGEDGDGNRRATVELDLEGLIPGGVYTAWVVHRPTWHRPLGGNDGENNVFRADADGVGRLETVDEPAELTLPPGATTDEEAGVDRIPVTECPLDVVDEFVIVGAYHYDDRTWGSQPGPFFLPQFTVPFGMDE